MKHKFICSLLLMAILGLFVLPTAQAQLGSPTQLVATNMATAVVSTNNLVLPKCGINGLAVQLVLNGLGAGATNSCSVLIQKSVDNVNWLTHSTVDLTGTGATTVSCISNINATATNLRLRTITSTANGTGTNLNVEVWVNRTQ